MSFDAYMHFDHAGGVACIETKGESQASGYEGWLEIKSFGFGIETVINMSSASGGAGAGRADFKEFTVTKQVDTCSAPLVKTCVQGGHYKNVKLFLQKMGAASGRTGDPYLKYNFKMVAVQSVEWSGSSGDDVPEETVIFQYGAIKVEYIPQLASGALDKSNTMMATWSRMFNNDTFGVPGD